MMDDLEQKIKEKLLESLIDEMSDPGMDKIAPKSMAVQVAAPDKEKLAEGLDKAKGVLGDMPGHGEPDGDEDMSDSHGDDSDEQRLMDLLDNDDDEDEKHYGRG